MNLYFDFAGMSFRVNADVEDGVVEEISKVEAVSNTGDYVKLEVDPIDFFDTMEDYLNDAVEKAILDEQLIHGDMLFEQRREEGKL